MPVINKKFVMPHKDVEWFKNKDGRMFRATDTLRLAADGRGLTPCSAPKQPAKKAAKKKAAKAEVNTPDESTKAPE